MDAEQWQQVRNLFDAVCDLPADQWRTELQRLTSDPGLVQRTVELLEAQTVQLGRVLAPLEKVMARAVEPEQRVGDELGPWRLTERLASGGMGTVFLAQRADDLYQQQVAVKLLPGLPDPRTAERLAAERRILAGLQHPNVARLYDGGTTSSGQPYLVMEYVDGQPLDRYCEAQSLGLEARLDLFLRICAAVQAAHEKLVVHCDLKPSNVLVTREGEPILLDFGIARLLDGAMQAERIEFCTPGYASPEIIAGQPVGVASDVFSLGVMLVEMLAARRLERGLADTGEPVALPSQWAGNECPWRRRLAGDLDAIAGKACALDPAERYASVASLANDVRRYLSHYPVHARQGAWPYRARRGLRRHWQAVALSTAIVAMASGFVWRLVEARAQAEEEAAVAQQVSDFLVASFEAADPRLRGNPSREVTAREVLDAGAAKIDSELADAPAQLARLKVVLGKAYQHMGQPQQAGVLLQQAAEVLLDPRVGRPADAAQALSELAVLLSNQGRGEDAEVAARRALELLEGQGRDIAVPVQAHAFNSLGLALMGQQRFDEAEAAFERSLRIRSALPPSTASRGIATVKHNLGLLYRNRGDNDRSERILREVLDDRRLASPSGSEYQGTLLALGVTLTQQGRLREAEPLYRENLELSLALYGEDSAKTALAHSELAGLYQDLGEYGDSTREYARALEITARVEGGDSVSHAIQLNNFATLEEMRGDMVHAEQLYRQSLAIRRQHLGDDAPASLRAESNLGRLLMRRGRLAEALPLIQRPLGVWSELLEAGAPDLRISRLGHAEWQIRSGRFAEAGTALAALSPGEGWPASHRLRHRQLLAELAQRSGDGRAADLWKEALQASIELYGADSVPTAKVRIPLAETLLVRGERAGAGEQLGLAEPWLRAQLVPDSEFIRRVDRLLAAGLAGMPAPGLVAGGSGEGRQR